MVTAEKDRKFLKSVYMQQPGIRACTCNDSARQKLEGLGNARLPGSCRLNDQGHYYIWHIRSRVYSLAILYCAYRVCGMCGVGGVCGVCGVRCVCGEEEEEGEEKDDGDR